MSDLWKQCLEVIKNRINSQSFKTWFGNTSLHSKKDGKLIVLVKNKFTADWLEKHHLNLITDTVHYVTGDEYDIKFVYKDNQGSLVSPDGKSNIKETEGELTTEEACKDLNPKFTFDKFVVGDFNKFAHAAALAISEAPEMSKYNPLYIYGGVGLGKTHLIQAIGHFINREHEDKKVIYVSAEKFTQDFIDSLINKEANVFNKFYRNVDVLLIDDIQFLSGKEGIQDSFFHIFNSLHQQGNQIVLTSDCEPNHISGLEERLLSRLKWGLVVDIQPPDLESRIAILQKKMAFDGIALPKEIVNYIARNVTQNIRDLEGALIKLLAHSSISGEKIDISLAREAISQYITSGSGESRSQKTSIKGIKTAVADHYSISAEKLTSKKRTKKIAQARQIAMYLTRKSTEKTLKDIGEKFGGRDHSTVIHACKKIETLSQTDQEIMDTLEELESQISR